jgi:hypothetical protein
VSRSFRRASSGERKPLDASKFDATTSGITPVIRIEKSMIGLLAADQEWS